MKMHYILFNAFNDVFEDEGTAKTTARERAGWQEGEVICLKVVMPEPDDLLDLINPTQGFTSQEASQLITTNDDPGPVAIYGAFAPEEEAVSVAYPGKIKEVNIAAMGNAYKDAHIIEKLRKILDVEQICAVLNAMEDECLLCWTKVTRS